MSCVGLPASGLQGVASIATWDVHPKLCERALKTSSAPSLATGDQEAPLDGTLPAAVGDKLGAKLLGSLHADLLLPAYKPRQPALPLTRARQVQGLLWPS